MAAADEELAALYGLPRAVIAEVRKTKLTEGLHYTMEGQRLVYTPAGLDELPRLLGIAKKEGGPPPLALPSPTPPKRKVLLIVKVHPNPIWVQVRVDAKTLQNVRVRHSKGLKPGRGLECVPMAGGAWHCVHAGYGLPLPKAPEKKEGGAEL